MLIYGLQFSERDGVYGDRVEWYAEVAGDKAVIQELKISSKGVKLKASILVCNGKIQGVLVYMCGARDMLNKAQTVENVEKRDCITVVGIIDMNVEVTQDN